MLDHHWREFGVTLKAIHACRLPEAIAREVRRETYSPRAREAVRMLLERVRIEVYDEPVAAETAELLNSRREQILDLVDRAGRLAARLRVRSLPFVLCHSDLHAGNFLIAADGAFYLVDWDEIIMAPKERDLMFVGGGVAGDWHSPHEEGRLFYEGYGPTEVDPVALAYFRYDRIAQDIAAFGEQILLTEAGGEDRAQSLRYLSENFEPNGAIETAYLADRAAPDA
jgi:spectinomycin phosphotransferase